MRSLDEIIEEGLKHKLIGGALAAGVVLGGIEHTPAPTVQHPTTGATHTILSKKPVVKSSGSFSVNGKKYDTYFPKLAYPSDNK